jgi:pilus assembly protein TadC
VLEIVAMGISVGMSVEEMFEFVVRVGPPCARPLFDAAVSEFRAGHSRNQILTGLAQRGGSAVSPVADVLIAADRDGAPTALVLDRLAGEAGRAHALAAEERARRAPVLMLAPLTLCSLPSVIVGTIAPFVFLTFGQTSL